jgi:small subunit ribosomal protein S6
MDVREYELTFILPPAMSEDEINALQENVIGWITAQQGEVLKNSHWGRRHLAYAINNYKEGYYILLQIKLPGAGLKEIDRRMRLDGTILRHLIVRLDEA